jgi:hypothetical protein
MPNAQGVFKQTRVKRQAAKGTVAATGGAQIMRRESSTFALKKDNFTTESEITSTMQVTANRHGAKQVDGKLTGLLSPGTYSDVLAALLRRDFAAVAAITNASFTIANGATVGGVQLYTLTRAAGSFLTDGAKVGMVGRLTAGAFNAGNLNKNLFITAVTALALTVMTLDGSALTAQGPIATATLTFPGKTTFVPTAGHTNVYYTVEEWMSDVPASEVNSDVKFTQAALSLPGSGNAKIDLTAMGLNQTNSAAAYFVTPTAETTTAPVVAASGALLVGGVPQAVITDLSVNIDGSGQVADPVVGTTLRPDVFSGKIKVSGQFSAYFADSSIHTAFLQEQTLQILSALCADGSAGGDFITLAMTSVNINSSDPDDAETGIKRTYQYFAELDAGGGAGQATEKTTLQIQDSQAQ